jgi:xanthine dehydrogenase accessory factor
MKQLVTWRLISQSLHKQIPVMLLYVVESIGSSPGRSGFFMAVNQQGEMEGSMGGGIMEHKFVQLAKARLKVNAPEASLHHQVHNKESEKNQSGMICSGEQTIFLYNVPTGDLQSVDEIISTLENLQTGILKLSHDGISFSVVSSNNTGLVRLTQEKWKYESRIGYADHLYIIGGGHCALALSRIMYSLDFYIHLFDDRQDLHTMEQNNFIHEMNVIEDYSLLKERVPGVGAYIAIMTFGYRTDDIALRSVMNKNYKYLGVLGSQNKIKKMFLDYIQQGIPLSILNNIHAPIGLSIKSQTPEEIAVSIAAEIIMVKNERRDVENSVALNDQR